MNTAVFATESSLEFFKRLSLGDQFRAERSFLSESGVSVHICALCKLDIESILNRFSLGSDIRYWIVNTEHLYGAYFEFSSIWMFIYQPQETKISLGVDLFNQSVDSTVTRELVEFGRHNGINNLINPGFDVFIAMFETYTAIIAKIFGLQADQVHRIKLINTYKTFFNNYMLLESGIKRDYLSHSDVFSWIYFVEIQAIIALTSGMSAIHIHDVATNTGNFPMLLAQLVQKNLSPFPDLSISCSDYNENTPKWNMELVQESLGSFKSKVNVEHLDLRINNPSLFDADVIIANDILEHFSEVESEHIFNNLWSHTKNILIIHVPIEVVPNKYYGHYTGFTDEKLSLWASKLPDCINMTTKLLRPERFKHAYDLTGFLVLKRNV